MIDAHTHLLPERLGAAIRRFFDANLGSELAYGIDNQLVLNELNVAGVHEVWNLPYAHKAGMSDGLNADMLVLATELRHQPVRIVTGCTVHPSDVAPATTLRIAVDGGAKVLKLHCSVGNYEVDDPRLTPVLAAAGELSIPVVVHAGHDVSGETAGHEIVPLAAAAGLHPDTTFVLAHFGHRAISQAAAAMRLHPNLFADLTPVVASAVPLTRELAEEFPERLLFGSDAPNTGFKTAELYQRLLDLDLPAETLASITSGTAASLVS